MLINLWLELEGQIKTLKDGIYLIKSDGGVLVAGGVPKNLKVYVKEVIVGMYQ